MDSSIGARCSPTKAALETINSTNRGPIARQTRPSHQPSLGSRLAELCSNETKDTPSYQLSCRYPSCPRTRQRRYRAIDRPAATRAVRVRDKRDTVPMNRAVRERDKRDTVPINHPELLMSGVRERDKRDTVPINRAVRERDKRDTVPINRPELLMSGVRERDKRDTVPSWRGALGDDRGDRGDRGR